MEDIFKVYDNEIGIAFKWQRNADLIQVIFRDIGFLLSIKEIALFLNQVLEAKQKQVCEGCKLGEECRSMLLKTPSSKVGIAISLNELDEVEDLLRGTLFQERLDAYLERVCKK